MGLETFNNNVRDRVRSWLFNSEQRSSPFHSFTSIESFVDSVKIMLGINPDAESEWRPSASTAMRISTFFTCVLVRAESLASLPAHVCQYTPKGSVKAYNHPAHYVIHDRTNPFQTASDFWKQVSAHIDNYGEAIGVMTFNGKWQLSAINLFEDPNQVDMKIVDGRPYFEFKGKSDILKSRVYEDWEIVHFKDLSLDGKRGCSRVRYNAEMLGYAAKLKHYGKTSIGTKPPGYFSSDAPFDTIKTQQADLGKAWKENIAKGLVPFLPLGLKYHHMMISPENAQYFDSIQATKEDICGIMRVPPTLIQNYERATFANAEQQDLVFIKYTMLPLITNIEQELNSKIFAESNRFSQEPYYVKINVSAFMRGDFKSRSEGYQKLFQVGAINGDTIADLEDWNKWDGGDRRFVPMNMVPLDSVDEFVKALTEKKATPPAGGNDDEAEAKRSFEILQGFLFNQKRNGHTVNGHG